jgi:protein phosphatase 1 regulatory subunit 10
MEIDANAKKRKAADAPLSKTPPTKKTAAVGNGTTSTVVKKDPTTNVSKAESKSAVGVVKTDNSFFSVPKKKALPSFTKKPAPGPNGKKEDISQPSNFDPFQEAMDAMMKSGTVTSAGPAPAPASAKGKSVDFNDATSSSDAAMLIDRPSSSAPVSSKPSDLLKRSKSVTFAPDHELEQVRWIDKADYGDNERTEVRKNTAMIYVS